jgi:hypothetical protein
VRKHNPCYLKRTHKVGIEVPNNVKVALELDKRNGNTFWADAIAKEMKDVLVAFKVLLDRQSVPISCQKILCHIILDIKMEDFQCKARLFAGGHLTKASTTITDPSVVSCETICLALSMAALNETKIKVVDVLNDYITAPITKEVCTVHGPEFGIDASKSATFLGV